MFFFRCKFRAEVPLPDITINVQLFLLCAYDLNIRKWSHSDKTFECRSMQDGFLCRRFDSCLVIGIFDFIIIACPSWLKWHVIVFCTKVLADGDDFNVNSSLVFSLKFLLILSSIIGLVGKEGKEGKECDGSSCNDRDINRNVTSLGGNIERSCASLNFIPSFSIKIMNSPSSMPLKKLENLGHSVDYILFKRLMICIPKYSVGHFW